MNDAEVSVKKSTSLVTIFSDDDSHSRNKLASVDDCGGGTTRPLPRDGGAEELRGDPTIGPHPKVWTIDRE